MKFNILALIQSNQVYGTSPGPNFSQSLAHGWTNQLGEWIILENISYHKEINFYLMSQAAPFLPFSSFSLFLRYKKL